MADRIENRRARRVGFLLFADFPLLCLSGAIDALRHANRFAEAPAYATVLLSETGAPVSASNGLSLAVDGGPEAFEGLDRLFLVCGFHPETVGGEKLFAALRRASRRGVSLGGISAGAIPLARAGLLDGYACAVHWEYAGIVQEAWPDIDVTDRLFVIDRDRATCAGGSATAEMFLSLVAEEVGAEIAAQAAEQMLIDRVRSTLDRQSSAALLRAKARSAALAAAIEQMESHLEAPLSMLEIASLAGLTRRQLHRLFREHFGMAPTDFYRDLRLRRARTMLRETPAKVVQIALASGFGSHSHFSKVYRERFGVSPLQERRSAP